jgi:hypothetical protein
MIIKIRLIKGAMNMEGMSEGMHEESQHLSTNELNAKLNALREDDSQRRAELRTSQDKKIAEMGARIGKGERLFKLETMEHLRQAEVADYMDWLKGFMEAGGSPTHFYDYDMPTKEWFMAESDLVMPPMYGVSSVNVIVPTGVEVGRIEQKNKNNFHDVGHNNLYFEDGFVSESGFVPVYKDTTFEEK